ncbi:MAG: hypothetical protein U5K37_02645 [Natrialbaceae archaeon]|nr:hypothetical protein [Natrialbaceae archaeon]
MTGITGIGAYTPSLRITAEAITEAWGQFQAEWCPDEGRCRRRRGPR